MRYVIVTPIRNEEAFIRATLDSVVAQTIKPAQWIIVDDASSDGTTEIVGEYMHRWAWIKLVGAKLRGTRERGGRVVRVFYAGFEAITVDYDFVVKLDGDVSFDERYFENLGAKFDNPKLGIAGGELSFFDGSQWRVEKTPSEHVRGATKVYRKSCNEDIRRLVPVNGWDGIDELRAQMYGWQTRTFSDVRVWHHRPMGAMEGSLKSRMQQGENSYFLGYTIPLITARSIYRGVVDRPPILGGLAILWGYIKSWIAGRPQFDDPELRAFLRKKKSVRRRIVRRKGV